MKFPSSHEKTHDEDDEESSDDIDVVSEDERDEVHEIKKMSAQDTSRIRMWRLVVTGCLVVTAVAITMTTYRFLKDEQKQNFDVAFEQFSRTVGDAALEEQTVLREGIKSLTDSVSLHAKTTNATWPFVFNPYVEIEARNCRIQSGAEVLALFPFVENKDRKAWIDFANQHRQEMVESAHMIQKGSLERLNPVGYKPFISKATPDGFLLQDQKDYYFPNWAFSPPPSTYGFTNWDVLSVPDYASAIKVVQQLKNETVVSRVRKYVGVPTAMTHEEHDLMHSKLSDSSTEFPHSFLFHPVHKDVDDYESPIVGLVGGGIAWDHSLRNLLPEGVRGITTIIKNTCNQTYTYEIEGSDAFFRGVGDFHDPQYDDKEVVIDLALHTHPEFKSTPGHCLYSMHVYPSRDFEAAYDTNTPEIFAAIIAITFAGVIIVFFVYDMFVNRRNEKLVANAANSNAIVSSLFPGAIRDRLIMQNTESETLAMKKKGNLKSFLNKGGDVDAGSKPLAELFLETTVLFADIVGFTAWSSVREPSQVFTLLETVYSKFDEIAKKRRIYKVETVGDCYVAVAGLPEPRKDHCIMMARFARDIIHKMQIVVRDLEVQLGPDTGDLSLRVGMHSGPVTAGVLRGERARFQLFGDTVNTCSRIESTGKSGMIHLSQATADLLKSGGKSNWVAPRSDMIEAKGKGKIQTFWLVNRVHGHEQESISPSEELSSNGESYMHDMDNVYDDRTGRLIQWNVEKLVEILKEILARREVDTARKPASPDISSVVRAATPLEEVKEIITLPEFDCKTVSKQRDPEQIEVPEEVVSEIRDYVNCIANMYRDNPFHNFAHASHVVMSVTKLMGRIVAPKHLEDDMDEVTEASVHKTAATLHDHTYGITSDPLTQFACAFSALIHDVDHTGIGNPQLAKENKTLGELYNGRSIAEQNSLDLAWDLFMDERYNAFRKALCSSTIELQHFRELVVNSVMATDIMDKDLKVLRNARWDKAFKERGQDDPRDAVNRKATIVIEHLIQASDVSHTMQHWHVYRKWNENLFREMYRAYKNGRLENDPSANWYRGEIGFLDFYVIPLAKKLKDCGVFGVSSDEYLNYATQNRNEWEARGQEVVAEMLQKVQTEDGDTE